MNDRNEKCERRLSVGSCRILFARDSSIRCLSEWTDTYQRNPLTCYQILPFGGASAECVALYTDGRFYGCVALAQSVAEAIVRFLRQKSGWKPERLVTGWQE